jgi:hypothetical protein
MTDMATTYRPQQNKSEKSVATATDSLPLITEQRVLFNTAAAGVLAPPQTRWWVGVIRALSAIFAAAEKPPAQRHYPKRRLYFENALMGREMDRL